MSKTFIPYFIGLDIGTSSSKAVAFNLEGRMLAQSSRPYKILKPEPGAAIQDPEEIYDKTAQVIDKIILSLVSLVKKSSKY